MLSPDLIRFLRVVGIAPSEDVEPVERGPNLYLALKTPALVHLVLKQTHQVVKVRRTSFKSASPFADADGLMITYEIWGAEGLWIDRKVAEDMIRSGEFIMVDPKETYQQDLYHRDDPWFQQNRAAVLRGREPQMP